MKKVLAMVLSFLIVIALSACGNTGMGYETKNNETADAGSGSQQTDNNGTGDIEIGTLQMDNNATVDIEIVSQFSTQGGGVNEVYSLSDVGFVDSLTALGEKFPVYVNPYAYGQEGPLFEVTDALKDTMTDNLTRYLGCLYADFDSQNAVFTSDADRPYDVYYTKDETIVHSYGASIKISSSDYALANNASDTEILNHTLVKTAMSYLGLTDPVISTTVEYKLDGTESCRTYRITDKASDPAQQIHNINFACITVQKYVSLDSVLVTVKNPVELTKHADVPVLSYSFVLAELAKLYPNMDTKDVKAEIYYSTSVEPGYFVPCYRIYMKNSDAANHSDTRYGCVDVLLTNQSVNEK